MNQTVELVKLWGEYESKNKNATIDGFCRSQLSVSIRSKTSVHPEWQMHPDLNGALIKLISRIGKFHEIYVNKALDGTGLNQIEEFGIMITIFNLKAPIKSEAIFSNMLELSSGTNILIRLKQKGLITEFDDVDDKRVKRLQLSPKGETVLKAARQQILKVVGMLVQDLTDDDKQLCLQLLDPISTRFSPVIQKQKNRAFEEIYEENCKF